MSIVTTPGLVRLAAAVLRVGGRAAPAWVRRYPVRVTRPDDTAARTLARAVVLALVAAACSTLAHAAAGGHLPSGSALLAVGAILTGLALPVARRAATVPRTAVLLAGLQVVAHVVHSTAAMVAASPSGVAAGEHEHAGGTDATALAGLTCSGHLALPSGGAVGTGHGSGGFGLAALAPSPTMLVAHLAAAALLAHLLVGGEHAWRTASLLRRLLLLPVPGLARLLDAARVCVPPAVLARLGVRDLVAALPTAPHRPVWRRPAPVRRGPPALLAV